VKNLADLYIYSNTLKAVKLNGAQVREWLERSAGQFNRIDPNKTEAQPLVDTSFPTYNFDVIDGVNYQVDLTQASRYDGNGKLVNPDAHRIVNLTFAGKPIDPAQIFLVATNNYRAGGGGAFPGLDGKNIVIDSPDENRQAVLNYIVENKTINPSADGNWSFAPIPSNPLVVFDTSPNAKAAAAADPRLKYLGDVEGGFARFSIDLSK
jgi:2',3'-cyclic-nucleotide 2'-phosphodiesterase/3'-nucleotidase